MKKNKAKNFFQVPHLFEEKFGNNFTPTQKYFYIVLRKLANRYATKEGWFWHIDRCFKTKEDNILGFKSFGFSSSTCKRTRKKLKEYKLIKTKYGWNKWGNRTGTYYKLNDEVLKD